MSHYLITKAEENIFCTISHALVLSLQINDNHLRPGIVPLKIFVSPQTESQPSKVISKLLWYELL